MEADNTKPEEMEPDNSKLEEIMKIEPEEMTPQDQEMFFDLLKEVPALHAY